MTLLQIESELAELGDSNFPFQKLIDDIEIEKQLFVKNQLQEKAKRCWIYQSILEIHLSFNEAYKLIREGNYYEGWCKLETAEITIKFLKQHFSFDTNIYCLMFLEKTIKNLQTIFPYTIFSSIELIELEKKCNICDQVVTIRKPCGHKIGEIYNGELCIRVVTKGEMLGIALVENPVNKYTVMFATDPKTKKQVDQYNYDTVDYLFRLINSPYEEWDLKMENKLVPHSQYKSFGRNDRCPCGSGDKYKKCCSLLGGVAILHYDFIVKKPTADRFQTNTVKKIKT